MYRISRNGQEPIVDVAQVEAIEPVIRLSKPGGYLVDEISSEPLPSGHTWRRWGVGIKRHDGVVTLDPDPWPIRTDDTQFLEAGAGSDPSRSHSPGSSPSTDV